MSLNKEQLKIALWIIKSDEIKKRDKYTCQNCNSKEHLAVHHIYPKGRGGKDINENLITLCDKCHYMVHQRRNIYIGFWIKHFKKLIRNFKQP